MMQSKAFWFVAGIAAVWGFHKFVRPLPGGSAGS
jgi:hypothetical protein